MKIIMRIHTSARITSGKTLAMVVDKLNGDHLQEHQLDTPTSTMFKAIMITFCLVSLHCVLLQKILSGNINWCITTILRHSFIMGENEQTIKRFSYNIAMSN